MSNALKLELLNYLKSHRLMSLATYGDTPWISWVFYVTDDNFNLYFVSAPDSKHIIDIVNNNNVACGITNTEQDPLGNKIGVQLQGYVEEVTIGTKLKIFFEMWKSVINRNETKLTYENYASKAIYSKVYKVVPTHIKWFNQNLDNNPFVLEL